MIIQSNILIYLTTSMMLSLGFLASNKDAYAEVWLCIDKLSGQSIFTATPTTSESRSCSPANLERAALSRGEFPYTKQSILAPPSKKIHTPNKLVPRAAFIPTTRWKSNSISKQINTPLCYVKGTASANIPGIAILQIHSNNTLIASKTMVFRKGDLIKHWAIKLHTTCRLLQVALKPQAIALVDH